VANKLRLEYENLGEHQGKNISTPIRVYRVLSYPGAAAHRVVRAKKILEKGRRNTALAMGLVVLAGLAVAAIWNIFMRPVPSFEPAGVAKASIAVLPFDNLSVGDEQEYFADGMTDELITNLSKISGLLVISRNSSFTYKGKPVKIQQVAKELDVRYVLEGSVQRDGERVRIRAQLIDGVTDHHLWAESYDAVMEDIFGLQDEITRKIAAAMAVKLTGEDQERFGIEETDNIEAYDALLKGIEHWSQKTPDGYANAISYYKLAIELDPNFSRAHAKLAQAYLSSSKTGFSGVWQRGYRDTLLARKHLEIAMSKPNATAHIVASEMALFRRRFDEATSNAERAIVLDPNDPDAHSMLAGVLISSGRPLQGLEYVKKSMRLDPHNISGDLYWKAKAHLCMAEYEKATSITESAVEQYPGIPYYWSQLAISYAHLGRIKEARSAWEKVLRAWTTPDKPNLAVIMAYAPLKSAECAEIYADGLLRAGCAGQPSGYYKIYAENRLSGNDAGELRSGNRLVYFYGKTPFWIDHSKDGKVNWKFFGQSYSGTWWIKDEKVCYRHETPADMNGLVECVDDYRNPDSAPGSKKEYLVVLDHGIYPYSVEK
jgi:TolB-like protein